MFVRHTSRKNFAGDQCDSSSLMACAKEIFRGFFTALFFSSCGENRAADNFMIIQRTGEILSASPAAFTVKSNETRSEESIAAQKGKISRNLKYETRLKLATYSTTNVNGFEARGILIEINHSENLLLDEEKSKDLILYDD